MSNNSIILSNEEEAEIITLIGSDGTEIDFVRIATATLDDKNYVILQPVELLEGMGEDEALVFCVEGEPDNEQYAIVLDDDIVDAVFELYDSNC